MKCKFDQCSKHGTYGIPGDKTVVYCKAHAKNDMIDVKSKRCIEDGCNKQPSYGLPGDKKATYCKEHAKNDMIDVKSKRCIEDGCNKQPSYGMLGDKKATYCKAHAKNDMIDVKSKRCIEDGCDTMPSYGLPGDKIATYCKAHAKADMIDVKHKRCIEDGCDTMPVYGLPGDKIATYCKAHAKAADMIDIKHKRCIEDGCDTRPTYGLPGDKIAMYCKAHAKNNMLDIKNKRCETCKTTRSNRSYLPNCSRCHFYLNPNDPRIRNYKTKEHAFMYPVADSYPDIILDKTVHGGCSKRRPDGLIDCLTHSIIIEIDENQHIGYESICDNRRTMELFTDLGSRPLIFIRLNPDSYKINNKRVNGVFKLSKSGELTMNNKEFAHRYAALLDAVDTAAKTKPCRDLSYVKLFYSDD